MKNKKHIQQKTARKKLFRYMHHILGLSLHKIRLGTAIDLFAKERNLVVTGNKREWLYNLYLSGEDEIIRKEIGEFYQTEEWRELRKKVLDYYGCECMKCKFNSPSNCVDHIKPRSKYPELQLDFNNMQVLCVICNLIKSNRTEIDYRNKNTLSQNLF